MKKYEQIDISGDAGLRIRGENLEALFENAAEGMFTLITDIHQIPASIRKEVNLKADSNEDALVQWLNELVFLYDTYGFIGKKFKVTFQGDTLTAEVSGGQFDPDRHESRLLIKAATYHNLSLTKTDSHWEATVIFDI